MPLSHAQEPAELEKTSDQGAFLVRITWQQNGIEEDNVFGITFVEPETGAELEDIQYDFAIIQSDAGQQVVRRVDQIASEQTVRFDKVGPYAIELQDIEGLGEGVSFAIEVTPEFGSTLLMAAVMAVTAMLAAGRLSSTNLFRSR